MTPSEAHDSALNRESGHDEMQEAILAALEKDWLEVIGLKVTDSKLKVAWPRVFKQAEALYAGKFGVAFADIALVFKQPNGARTNTWKDAKGVTRSVEEPVRAVGQHHIVLEIKPRIYSPAALLRQCRMLEHRLSACSPFVEQRHECSFEVFPVVPVADPALNRFVALAGRQYEILTWDGSKLEQVKADA